VTIELADGTYTAITEAAVFNYSGTSLQATGSTLTGAFLDDADGFTIEGTITTPWRVTMTGPTLNDLVNSDIVSNLCPAPDTQLFPNGMQTEWIQPGRSLWHWFSTENPSYEEHKQWVEAAAQMGFEYYLVDESWGHWKKEGQDGSAQSVCRLCGPA
jgi:alpha-glucosidase